MPNRLFSLPSVAIPLALLIAGCTGAVKTPVFETDLPGEGFNIAVILVDTLRPDYLGCYGAAPSKSPSLDAFASKGVVFEEARTASTYTGEAVSSLFMGRPPAMIRDGLGWAARPAPMEENLPKRLEAAGYRTGIFSTSFVMRFRGFYDSFQESALFPGAANTSALDQDLTDAALDFAKRHKNDRMFQYLHYFAPHAPYNPPEEFLSKYEINRTVLDPASDLHPAALVSEGMEAADPRLAELKKHYEGEIALIDREFARFMNGLWELGLDQKTVVVVLSDHGEEFMEHGFADHAWNLFDETLRIPMIFWAPALFPPARISDPVSIVDIMPTLLRCLQVPHTPRNEPVYGQYLFAPGTAQWEYTPRQGPLYASLFPETRAQLHAVLFDGHKYISGPRWLDARECIQFWSLQGRLAEFAREGTFLPLDPWAKPEHEALYELRADPGELVNVLDDQPALRDMGRRLLREYQDAGARHRDPESRTTGTDPFGDAFLREQMKLLVEEATDPDAAGEGGERLSPELIEGLDTMGYL